MYEHIISKFKAWYNDKTNESDMTTSFLGDGGEVMTVGYTHTYKKTCLRTAHLIMASGFAQSYPGIRTVSECRSAMKGVDFDKMATELSDWLDQVTG
jgi:hypothetical protein